MSRVLEINDLEALAGLRLLWNSLLPQTPGASFFHSIEWLQTYWQHYGEGQRLRVLVVYSEAQPVGILPLVVRTETNRLGSFRVLTYPLHDWGSFYGPIGPSPTATLLAGLGHLRRTARDWDLLDLRWVDRDGVDRGRTKEALAAKGFPAREELLAESSQIDLSGSWDAYWASRTSRWRNNVRRSEKKLSEQGKISYLRYRPQGTMGGDDDPRWDLYDACEDIARRSWQAASDNGTTLCHATVRAFLRDAHAAAARAGTLDLNLLLLDDRPVAFNYAYHYRGYLFGLRTGFDAAQTTGAGSTLQYRMIRDSFERGDHIYDLGSNYSDCKRYWRTHTAQSYRYTYFPATVAKAQVLRWKRSIDGWRKANRQASAGVGEEGPLVAAGRYSSSKVEST